MKQSDIVTFQAFALVSGKGISGADKVRQHIANGAEVGALVAAKVGRKAIIDDLANEGMARTIHALAFGNIRPAVALVVARAGKGVSIMEVNGKAPYSEWLRLGATLQTLPQVGKTGKATAAAKALALHAELTAKAQALRAAKNPDAGSLQAPASEIAPA